VRPGGRRVGRVGSLMPTGFPATMFLATAGLSSVAVAVTVIATLVVVALLAALVSVIRAARALQAAAEELARHSALLLDDLGGTLAHANAELDRVDDLVGSAEQLTDTVSVASRAAYVTLANPLIKVMALRRGSSRAADRWRARHSAAGLRPAPARRR
jgi:hypothetical protein